MIIKRVTSPIACITPGSGTGGITAGIWPELINRETDPGFIEGAGVI